jgi:phosphohistidine phosphatase SixA
MRPAQEYEIPDPELSELGQQQCRALEQHLRQHLPLADKIERIVTSPMRRTLETTTLGLDWLIKRGVPVEADALWQGKCSPFCSTFSQPNLPDSRTSKKTVWPFLAYT